MDSFCGWIISYVFVSLSKESVEINQVCDAHFTADCSQCNTNSNQNVIDPDVLVASSSVDVFAQRGGDVIRVCK